jgi:hypothetical protein
MGKNNIRILYNLALKWYSKSATCSIALSNIPRMKDRIKEGFLWFIKNLEEP